MKGCAHCGGKFGLIRRRWHSRQFCSLRCRETFLNQIAKETDKVRLTFPSRSQHRNHDKSERVGPTELCSSAFRGLFFNRVSAIMLHANCSNFGPHQRFSFDMILRRRGDPLGGYPLLGPGASRGLFFRAQWGIFFNTRDRSGSPSWAAS
jgi:endogenous inhibitor of DNA gyrase (YacG/DUF329 family)